MGGIKFGEGQIAIALRYQVDVMLEEGSEKLKGINRWVMMTEEGKEMDEGR